MRAGPLRERITIQANTPSQNSVGEPVDSWSDLVSRFASVEPLVGHEYFAARQENAEITVRFRLRYDSELSGLTPRNRISWDSRLFDIDSVINIKERNHELVLMCKEQI